MTKRVNADEQYKLILECRSSGLTDYQWCKERGINPGTFYNWVKRLRRKSCYDIPAPAGRDDYKPQEIQEVVPLMIIDDDPKVHSSPKLEQNNSSIASVAVLACNGFSISITNDINTRLLTQIFEYVGGRSC